MSEENDDTFAITIDGQRTTARAGETVIEVAGRLGVEIPTLCHDTRLDPNANNHLNPRKRLASGG